MYCMHVASSEFGFWNGFENVEFYYKFAESLWESNILNFTLGGNPMQIREQYDYVMKTCDHGSWPSSFVS